MSGGFEIYLWALLTVATLTDLTTGKIYNILTLPSIGIGLLCQSWHFGTNGAIAAILGVTSAFLFFYPLYLLKAFAAADVKLLMAVGAWSNTNLVIKLGVIAIMVGVIPALSVLIHKKGVLGGARNLFGHLRSKTRNEIISHRMPFAPAFLCAFLLLKVAEYYRWSHL